MKPPICAICDTAFFDERGGLVNFKKTAADRDWDKKAASGEWIGHPPYADWFCEDHLEQARSLSHLTLANAVKKMKAREEEEQQLRFQ